MKNLDISDRINKVTYKIIQIFCILLLSSCQTKESSKVDINDFQELNGTNYPEFNGLLCCNGLILNGNYLVINDWCSDSGFFNVFEYNPVRKIKSFSKKGRGPGEFISPFFYKNIITTSDRFNFSVYDLNLKLYVNYSLPSLDPESKIKDEQYIVGKGKMANEIFPCKNMTIVDSCVYGNDVNLEGGLYFIYDMRSGQKKWIDFQPMDFYKKHNLKGKSFIYENQLVINGQKNRIVTGMNYFNQVHFYDLKGSHIKSISVGDNILPTLNENNVATRDSYLYCLDLYATKEFVYVLWGGQKLKNYDSNIVTDSYVIVFTWEGNHVKTFKIRKSIILAINPDNSVLIAAGDSGDGTSEITVYSLNN